MSFGVLLLSWELVIRARYSAAIAPVIEKPQRAHIIDSSREWLVFGNCLVLNGISPAIFQQVWQDERPKAALPRMRNLAKHEYAPQAYLRYLRESEYYPSVIVFNVSSWLNSDNFEAEAKRLTNDDLLGLRDERERVTASLVGPVVSAEETLQRRVERGLQAHLSVVLRMSEKKYHLFDFGMFLRELIRSQSLERSLYELQIQSWYRLVAQHRDGMGQMAFEVRYSADWEPALNIMSEKQLSRMRLGNFLTDSFWKSLESEMRHFQQHGTKIVLLRMPEHSRIYEFNETSYRLHSAMTKLAERTGSPFLDLNDNPQLLSRLDLYDAVHPDHRSSMEISTYVAKWVSGNYPGLVYSNP